MILNSILVLTDFSAYGDKALERAGQIALAHRAVLRLMYRPSGAYPECPDPDRRLAQTAGAMAQRLGLTVRTVATGDSSPENVMLQAANARLLVLPQRSGQGWPSSWLVGPDAIRFTRGSRCPVLVARSATHRPHRQIVVGVDFTPASHHRAMFACLLERDAEVELFHVVDTSGESRLRRADVSRSVIRHYRENSLENARVQLRRMTQSLYAHASPVVSAAHLGDPAVQLMARLIYTDADLVVVGKCSRFAVTDSLFGSTAHYMLAHARCDVMVVPDDFQLSATPALVQRPRDPAPPRLSPWLPAGRQ